MQTSLQGPETAAAALRVAMQDSQAMTAINNKLFMSEIAIFEKKTSIFYTQNRLKHFLPRRI